MLLPEQLEHYSRQILLKEVGGQGMTKLLNATVTIVGAGGLGCPAIQMLAAAGVGHIRIIDGDIVELSNLPRQIMHYTTDIGKKKVQSVREKIEAMNPDIQVETFEVFADESNIIELLQNSDYVIEASDSPHTKFLVNKICIDLHIPFTIAGVVMFMGQIISIIPGESTCYRCVFQDPLEEGESESCVDGGSQLNDSMTCSGAGVMNTVPNFAGILQANEAIKSILGLTGKFLNGFFMFDLSENTFEFVSIKRNPNCPICGEKTGNI
jgi:molybdopterin/thiamine biosynthesis adenylyltransferase